MCDFRVAVLASALNRKRLFGLVPLVLGNVLASFLWD